DSVARPSHLLVWCLRVLRKMYALPPWEPSRRRNLRSRHSRAPSISIRSCGVFGNRDRPEMDQPLWPRHRPRRLRRVGAALLWRGACRMLRITINGRACEVREGATILEALRSIGTEVPTLCHDDRL